jgi:tetratricopeptide (TPR) repeat protein
LGLYDKARETLGEYLNNFPDNATVRRNQAAIYRYQRKFDLALSEMDKAFILAPTSWNNHRAKGDIYFYMGEFKRAEEEYLKLLEKEEPIAHYWGTHRLGLLSRLQGRFMDSIEWQKKGLEKAEELGETGWIKNQLLRLADLDILLGNPEEAMKKLDSIWESAVEDEDFSRQRRTLRAQTLAYLGMKRIADAQRTAEEFRELIEQGINKNHIRSYYYLMGRIALKNNDYSEAIEFFKKGLPFVYHSSNLNFIYADSLGRAYYESGDLEKTLKEYERIDTLPLGRLTYGDIYTKSFYMLGKIYEQQGDKAKAIENYEKFLDLWKDADPGLPEVDDARQRLSILKGSQ